MQNPPPEIKESYIHWTSFAVNQDMRSNQKKQRPLCIWFTGLSGAGKSTIANALEFALYEQGMHTYLLDGDNIRHNLNRDLQFSNQDRIENIRRVAEVAKLMVDAGLIVIASFISPFESDRSLAREKFTACEFIEVFVDAPLITCETRDPKGLYAKAREGKLVNFTGIDSPYEAPKNPDIHLNSAKLSPAECVNQILSYLSDQKILSMNA